MRRRDFIKIIGGTVAAWPFAASSERRGSDMVVNGLFLPVPCLFEIGVCSPIVESLSCRAHPAGFVLKSENLVAFSSDRGTEGAFERVVVPDNSHVGVDDADIAWNPVEDDVVFCLDKSCLGNILRHFSNMCGFAGFGLDRHEPDQPVRLFHFQSVDQGLGPIP